MIREDFSELAALAALDAIDERDIDLVEVYADASPEAQDEWAELRMAVGAIPYGAPTLPVPSDLKDRLFQHIELDNPVPIDAESPQELLPFFSVRSAEMLWEEHPVQGIKFVRLHEDPVKRIFSYLLRCEPGLKFPIHRHVKAEEIFMLEGDLVDNGQVYGPGDYLYSAAETIHAPETKEGCLFFLRTSLDNEFL